jgi:hypothetical protein
LVLVEAVLFFHTLMTCVKEGSLMVV